MRFTRILFGLVLVSCLLAIAIPAVPAQAAAGTISAYPISGRPGSVLAVTGTGFTPGSTYTVYFGGASLGTATVDPSGAVSLVSLIVPVLPRGPYSITVTTSAFDTSNPVTFNITPSITLDFGSGRVGDTVKVSGNGFAASATISISFDSGGATSTSSDPSGSFTNASLIVPPTSPGPHNITATDGLVYAPSATYTVAPRVTFAPNVQTIGSQITLSGNGFSANSPIAFYIDTIAVTSSATVADVNGGFSNATLVVPPLAQGTHILKAQDGNLNTATANLYIRPSLAINPQTGAPGATVRVAGNGFTANAAITVTYNNLPITTLPSPVNTNADGSFTATFTVPTGTTGTYSVQASDGTNSTSATFTISAGASLSPASGTIGTSITLNGSNFSTGVTVIITYDGSQVTTATTDSTGAFSATFKAPNSRAGAHQVTAADNLNSMTLTFTIVASASLSPASGYVDSSVTINGAGFGANRPINVNFDKIPVATATTDTYGAFSATFKTPVGASGTHQVAAADNLNNIATLAFTILSSASLSPASGLVDSSVTVKGSGFIASRSVAINYDNIQVATGIADAAGSFSITFKAPSSQSGTHQVTATDGASTAALTFTISPNASLNPTSGYVGGNVAIKGAGFASGKTVAVKYDNAQLVQTTTDASGSFSATFIVPASKGGNHLVSMTDGAATVTADFTMDSTPPPATVLLQPNATKADALASFSWSAVTDPSGVTYTLQIATDNTTFSAIVLEKKGLPTPGYTLTEPEKLKSASKEKPYYWRVRATDGASNDSPWSASKSFYVGFVLAKWVVYAIFAVVALIIGILGFWLGRKTYPFQD